MPDGYGGFVRRPNSPPPAEKKVKRSIRCMHASTHKCCLVRVVVFTFKAVPISVPSTACTCTCTCTCPYALIQHQIFIIRHVSCGRFDSIRFNSRGHWQRFPLKRYTEKKMGPKGQQGEKCQSKTDSIVYTPWFVYNTVWSNITILRYCIIGYQ